VGEIGALEGSFPSEALLKNFREAKWAGGTSKSEVK
jgi:hypothetical protein